MTETIQCWGVWCGGRDGYFICRSRKIPAMFADRRNAEYYARTVRFTTDEKLKIVRVTVTILPSAKGAKKR